VLHVCFTTYNVELAKYSPGILHWIESMKAAESLGITRIDFGKGPEPYKRRFMNGVTTVAEGAVDLRPEVAVLRAAWRQARTSIRMSPVATPARALLRMVRRLRCRFEMRSPTSIQAQAFQRPTAPVASKTKA
jgi:CelD/BcsL family acetyltransferase involved in cellulose biosynthesis